MINLNNTDMKLQATVSLSYPNKFLVFSEAPLKGQGIKFQGKKSKGFAHIVTEKAYDKLEKNNNIEFYNSIV